MNKIGFPKRLSMGWTNYVRLMSLLVFLGLSLCATAQEKAQLDLDRLVGVDPADIVTKENNYRLNVYYQTEEEEKNNELNGLKKTFFLMNVGTHKFLNIGGSYGRHATLNDHGMKLWIYDNSTTTGTYNIRTRQNIIKGTEDENNSDSYVQYVSNDPHLNGVYPDCQPTDGTYQYGWGFEQATGYSATNKVYKIKTYGDRYLTAAPDNELENKCQATTEAPADADYQLWKLVSLEQYFALVADSPSDSADPIDISFLILQPDMGYNKTTEPYWANSLESTADNVRYGIEHYYKKYTEDYYKDKEETYLGLTEYLFNNGKYFCADIQNVHATDVRQMITIDKPGYYIVRCNGFTNKKGLAKLFAANYIDYAYYGTLTESTELPLLEDKSIKDKDLLDAGKAFHDGSRFKNEVTIHVSQNDIDIMGEGKAYLFIGINIGGDKNVSAEGEWTAFDNFRLLYYGEEAKKPELVLDEDNPDLNYLTETSDTYENVTLHLNRSFTLNKWNTLTLPVSLTYGQMKSAFGDDVLLAELDGLTATSVRFQTVNCTSDNDVMLKAFTPYIIKPTKKADATTEAYTTPRLKKTPNQYWLASGVGEINSEDGETRHTSGKVEVKAGHYTIDGVTIDREALKTNLDNHWVSKTTTSASEMVCKGTMAKTYYVDSSKKGWFYTDNDEKRDNLAGDYFMKDGTMYKVPATKQYGLKAFRCWFELSKTTDNTASTIASAKDVSLFIDDIKDGVTGIDDITTDPNSSNAKNLSGVYNIYGQRLSDGSSLDNLPQGIYIVNGKKVRK